MICNCRRPGSSAPEVHCSNLPNAFARFFKNGEIVTALVCEECAMLAYTFFPEGSIQIAILDEATAKEARDLYDATKDDGYYDINSLYAAKTLH